MYRLLAVVSIVLGPRLPEAPTLKHEHGSVYTIRNPSKRSIEAVLDCGSDWEKAKVVVKARSSETLDIQTGEGNPPFCMLESWVERSS